MGKNHMPPVPPEERSDKGPGDTSRPDKDTSKKMERPVNTEERARWGNINQNTHNVGYQQDR